MVRDPDVQTEKKKHTEQHGFLTASTYRVSFWPTVNMKKLKKFQHLTATVKGLPAVVIQPGLKCKRGKCKEAPNMLAELIVVLLVIVNGFFVYTNLISLLLCYFLLLLIISPSLLT